MATTAVIARRLFLARHGETAWNALGKLQGHTDIALNETGRAQARALAEAVRASKIARVVASDLARARETAEIVAATLGLPAPTIDPELRERRFGIFEGLTRDECAVRHPEAWRAWLAQTGTPPGGEDRPIAAARLQRALLRVLGDEPALVICHGGVMRLFLLELLGGNVPLIGNGTTYVVDHDGAAFKATLL